MPSITLKNVQFTNVKDKRQGLKMSNILTQSNVGSQSVANYVNSENFYKLVSALDIAWGDISVGNGVIISDTADLINWISSLPASGGGGKSAYELYVEEEEGKGNTPLSLSEWLESLQGQQGIDGVSPHIDPSTGNWFIGETNTGVHAQGIDGSQGPQGLQGKSNYELYLETVPQGETPLTQLEWLNSLKGQDGTNGVNGDDGKSAYEIYVDHVPNGSTALTEEEWLASLKGKDGKDGPRGFEGKSAYEIYFDNTEDPLDVDKWLASLKGADGTMSFEELTDEQRASLVGETGPAGPSAYQSYRNTTTDDPILTEEEWVASLHGQTGADGTTPHIDASTKHWFIGNTDTNILAEGVNGQDGKPGADGSNGITPHIDPTTGNWFIGETDTEIHAQGVPGIDGSNGITPHIDASTGNWFIGETDTKIHAQGETGQPGADGITPHIDASTGNWFIGETNTGIPAQGPIGQNGADGSTGKSAYELYVDGIQEEPLSQEDWLASLKGDKGDSAYKVAVANGFAGTEQQWLDSLLPTINTDPSSNNASDIYWFIKGEKTQYRAIPQIISITSAAYEALQEKDETAIYVITDSQYNQDNEVTYRIGNITPTTDMNDLDVSVRRSNNVVYFDFTLPIANLDINNLTEAQATLLRGKSNYQIYVDNHDVDLDGPLLTEEQWLATLKGEVGNDGKSAYELYVKNYISTHGDDTGILTESEWLNSLIPQIVKDSSDNLYWHINNQKTQYRAFPGIQFLTLDEYNALETKEDDVVYIIDNDKDATALTFNIGNVTTSALETDASVNIRRIDNSIYFDFVLPFSIDSSEYKGESAYEIYKRNASTGEVLSETAWLDSLKGKSAYELFAAANPTSVYTNESQWLASLKGETGKDGSQGPQGPMPTITINQEGNWVVNDQVMPQSALGRLPEIRDGLYIDPETGDELSMKTWWIDGADTNVPTSLGVDVTTLNNKIGAIGNAQEYEPSTYYTAEDQEVIDGTKAAGDLKTSAIPAVPHTVKSYVDNAVANVHVDIDASNIYTKEEVDQKFVNLIGQAPETLDTLKEIADKLNDENTSLGQLNAVLLNKADTSTTYTKSEVNTLYNNINSSLNYYVLKTDLDDTEKVIATTLVQLNESVTNIDASIINIRQNAGSVNPNDLSIYELKEDLINDLSIYELKSDLANDLSIYTSKAYVDQKFSDLINNAPATLDTLKEIADKLSDEDTSLGQLNAVLAVKADTSTTYTKSEVDTLIRPADWDNNDPESSQFIKNKPFGTYRVTKYNEYGSYKFYLNNKLSKNNDGHLYHTSVSYSISSAFSEAFKTENNRFILYVKGTYAGIYTIIKGGNFFHTQNYDANVCRTSDDSKYEWAFESGGNNLYISWLDINDVYTTIENEVFTLIDFTFYFLDENGDIILNTPLDAKYININSVINDKSIPAENKPFGEIIEDTIISNIAIYDKSSVSFTKNGPSHGGIDGLMLEDLLSLGNVVTIEIDGENLGSAKIKDETTSGYTIRLARVGEFIPNAGPYSDGWTLFLYSGAYTLAIYDTNNIYKSGVHSVKISKATFGKANAIKKLDIKYVDYNNYINNPTILDSEKPFGEYYYYGEEIAFLETSAPTPGTGADEPNKFYPWADSDEYYPSPLQDADKINIYIDDILTFTCIIPENFIGETFNNGVHLVTNSTEISGIYINKDSSDWKYEASTTYKVTLKIQHRFTGVKTLDPKYIPSSILSNYVTVADVSANEYVIASALIELNNNKADKDTTYTKAEIDSIIENLDNGVDSNDLSIYELKSDLTNDLSIYELKSDLANDLSIYVLNSSLIEIEEVISGAISSLNTNKVDVSTLNDYVQKTTLANSEKVIATALVQLNESVTNIDASITSIKQNGTGGTINPNDLSIYELKEDLINDLSIYQLKSTLINDISMYELKSDLKNDLSIYVLNSSLIDVEEVIAESISQLNDTLDELSGNVYTKDEIDNLVTTSNDLSIYELKSDLANDLSIYELKSDLSNDLSIYELKSDLANDLSIYVLKTDLEDNEKVIATTLIQINDAITTIDASIVDIKQNGSGNSGINSSVLDDYVLKTYIGTLPNKTENIYYTQEEITNASVGDDAYGKTTADIKTPATQYIDLMEAIQEDEEVTAAAIVDMNSKVTDISTRLDNIVSGPAIWVGTQSEYNALTAINQSTIYIIKADEL